jgi:hypothetical protein
VRQKKIARKMSQFIHEVKPKSFIGRAEQACDPKPHPKEIPSKAQRNAKFCEKSAIFLDKIKLHRIYNAQAENIVSWVNHQMA